jgi:hypothetical protein
MVERKILNFGLIGAAGYITSRHLKASKETGNNIIIIVGAYWWDPRTFTITVSK